MYSSEQNQKQIHEWLEDICDRDLTVNITISGVPTTLLRKFAQRIVKSYPGGISDAIRDLMAKAVEEQQKKENESR